MDAPLASHAANHTSSSTTNHTSSQVAPSQTSSHEMISLEEAQEIVLSKTTLLPTETVSILEAVGRVIADDLQSDIDVSSFAHSSMDGFAVRASELAQASKDAPVELDVIAEVAAGGMFEGSMAKGQCVRIMTGACLPSDADAVVKYEVVDVVSGDGLPGSRVSFTSPARLRENVREAGEDARAGETILQKGSIVNAGGVGFLASCGVLNVPTYRKPRVTVIATGTELVDPREVPAPGKIRNSNGYAMAACVQAAGGVPLVHSAVKDDLEALKNAVRNAVRESDAVVTTGGASNGDFDFIKQVMEDLGEVFITSVNMKPGKSQTFGIVDGVPVFGLPGNPAAAYVGFELIVRPALRKMQGHTHFARPTIKARLTVDIRKKDRRLTFSRGTITKGSDGAHLLTPAKNQSSGLYGVIQRSNCLAIMPAGSGDFPAGTLVDCILMDVAEEIVL